MLTTDPGFTPGVNQPPTVDAGPDQEVILPDAVALDGTVSDDGQRFLVVAQERDYVAPITITVNWPALLER